MNLNDNKESITFKDIWKQYAITGIKFDKSDLVCRYCNVRRDSVLSFYRHMTSRHLGYPITKESIKDVIVERFTHNPPKPKPKQESISY